MPGQKDRSDLFTVTNVCVNACDKNLRVTDSSDTCAVARGCLGRGRFCLHNAGSPTGYAARDANANSAWSDAAGSAAANAAANAGPATASYNGSTPTRWHDACRRSPDATKYTACRRAPNAARHAASRTATAAAAVATRHAGQRANASAATRHYASAGDNSTP